MNLSFLPTALDRLRQIKQTNPVLFSKLKTLIDDTLMHPATGLGEPARLEGRYENLWARKLPSGEILAYCFDDSGVLIVSIALMNPEEFAQVGKPLKLESFSDEEYSAVLAQMAANRGKDSEPKVGIFWYDRGRNELFGIVSHRISDYDKANASDGRITCSEMHEDIWKREFRRRKYHGEDMYPYIGNYQDKPRGRIFYQPLTGRFEVAVGKWIEEYPQAYDLIVREFDLPPENTSAKNCYFLRKAQLCNDSPRKSAKDVMLRQVCAK